jgi:LacI family transcriptional regulator
MVILDNAFNEINIDSITINNVQGASEAVRYLKRMGHKKIGHLRSSVGINNFYERRDGFLKGLGPHHENIQTLSVSSTSEGAYQDMKQHLEHTKDIPSAFFADNDIIAISCIRALHEADYQIPDQVSVIGFDDIPASAVIDPPLSTMRVPKKSMGIIAVERLIRKGEDEISETIRIEVNTELIIRSSVKSLI